MKGLMLSIREGDSFQITLPNGQAIYFLLNKVGNTQVELKAFADESIKIDRSEIVD